MTFKCIHSLSPQYLNDLLCPYVPSRNLRSSSKGMLVEKVGRLKKADRAFSIAAPKLWNKLPHDIRQIDKLSTFKCALKTFYFKQAFEQ